MRKNDILAANEAHMLIILCGPHISNKGTSLRLKGITDQLSDFKIHVLAYPDGNEYTRNGTIIFRPEKSKAKFGRAEVSLRRILLDYKMLKLSIQLSRKYKYRIIQGEDFEGSIIAFICSRVTKESKFVIDFHNSVVDNLKINNRGKYLINIVKSIETFLVKKADLVIFNWEVNRKLYGKKAKISVTWHDQVSTKTESQTIPTSNYLVYAGNFEPYQGIEDFINEYLKTPLKLPLVLVGNAPQEIRNKIKNNSNIVCLGNLSTEQTNSVIDGALAGILPRTSGIQPSMKLVHYLSRGKPVIAKNIQANQELLEEGVNAKFYDDYVELLNLTPKQIQKLNSGANRSRDAIAENWKSEFVRKKYLRWID